MSSELLPVQMPPISSSAARRKITFVPRQNAASKWFLPGQTSS